MPTIGDSIRTAPFTEAADGAACAAGSIGPSGAMPGSAAASDSVRRTPDPIEPVLAAAGAAAEEMEPELPPQRDAGDGLVRIESPMVGTFYRAPQPGAPPFVEEGDAVAAGQTLCILEAMKLMNEVKADQEAVVRAIHVGNAEPVEYGQLLFELEPINGRPLGL